VHTSTGEVHLQGGVDGDHVCGCGRDVARVVVYDGRIHLEHLVAIDEIVETLGAHAEGGDDLPLVEALALTGDDPLLHQVDDPVAENISVCTPRSFFSSR
jgi:hypothetical protein